MKFSRKLTTVITLKVSANSLQTLQGRLIRLARECRGYSLEYIEDALGIDIKSWEKFGTSQDTSDLEEMLEVAPGSLSKGCSEEIQFTVRALTSDRLQGKLIELARKAKGLSQQDLADCIKVNRTTISNWENRGIGQELYLLEQCLGLESGAFKI